MELFEVRDRLKEILSEFDGFGNFSINTMSRVEARATEVKLLSSKLLGEEDEVTAEMDSVIVISKNYHAQNLGLENETIKGALIHLEYGIGLFLKNFEI